MFLKSKFFRVVCALTLLLALFTLVFADTIRLKDGSIIKGKIINFSNGQFTVLIGEGSRQRRMNFFADEIESIEFDSTMQPVATVRTNTQLPQKTNTSSTTTNNSVNSAVISNNTVITVGQNTNSTTSNDDTETIIVPSNTSANTMPTTNTNTTNTNIQPIQLKVKVLADNTANGWTNSGWVVKRGQRIKISARGNISLGGGKYSSPGGIASLADKDKLMQQEATGGLIAVVGDDNNDFIFIGAEREFTATRDGSLFLGINEGNLDDNSGSFDITVEIMPEN